MAQTTERSPAEAAVLLLNVHVHMVRGLCLVGDYAAALERLRVHVLADLALLASGTDDADALVALSELRARWDAERLALTAAEVRDKPGLVPPEVALGVEELRLLGQVRALQPHRGTVAARVGPLNRCLELLSSLEPAQVLGPLLEVLLGAEPLVSVEPAMAVGGSNGDADR